MAQQLLKVLILGLLLSAAYAANAHAVTFEVNVATDIEDIQIGDTPNACDVSSVPGSQCTLRAALQESNATSGNDRVTFDIPGDQVHSIALASALPLLHGRVLINGFSQPGASPNTRPVGKPLDTDLRIELDGGNLGAVNGFDVAAGGAGSTIRGLSIVNFGLTGVSAGTGAVRVEGNFLGTTPAGQQAGNEGGFQSFVESSEVSVIGGPDPGDSNLISGNAAEGIRASQGVRVTGNRITLNGGGNGGAGCRCGAITIYSHRAPDRVVGNAIQDNVYAGVMTHAGNQPPHHLISRNIMSGNELVTRVGIDLGGNGVTPNDIDESDFIQNFPALSSAKRHGKKTNVSGLLRSSPKEKYRVEFFQADGETRQGRRFVGSEVVRTNSAGRASFDVSLGRPQRGKYLTATATRISGGPDNTSEFSKPKEVK